MKPYAPALYRYCAAQLFVKKVLAVSKVAELCADRVDNVLNGLGVVEVMQDFALLEMGLAMLRRDLRSVRPLHACNCTHTAGAGG